MNSKLKDIFYKGLTWSFFILWILVAIISMYHTCLFFMVGNPLWLAGIMSVAFEVGLALSLFSILTTDNNKSIIPWSLMSLLTIVQICGNVYSVYKYMIEAGTASTAFQYINGSFLHWFVTDMPQGDVLSIIAIMLGAVLPIVALFMTDMVANNFKLRVETEDKEKENKTIEPENEPNEPNKLELNEPNELDELDESGEPDGKTLSNMLTKDDKNKEENTEIGKNDSSILFQKAIENAKVNPEDSSLKNQVYGVHPEVSFKPTISTSSSQIPPKINLFKPIEK